MFDSIVKCKMFANFLFFVNFEAFWYFINAIYLNGKIKLIEINKLHLYLRISFLLDRASHSQLIRNINCKISLKTISSEIAKICCACKM